VFYDLVGEDEAEHVSWLTRSKGFFPMEYSNLGLEYFSPDYIDFFYQLPQWKKDELLTQQDLLYKGISAKDDQVDIIIFCMSGPAEGGKRL
jgi:lysine N6-hydroxylase